MSGTSNETIAIDVSKFCAALESEGLGWFRSYVERWMRNSGEFAYDISTDRYVRTNDEQAAIIAKCTERLDNAQKAYKEAAETLLRLRSNVSWA